MLCATKQARTRRLRPDHTGHTAHGRNGNRADGDSGKRQEEGAPMTSPNPQQGTPGPTQPPTGTDGNNGQQQQPAGQQGTQQQQPNYTINVGGGLLQPTPSQQGTGQQQPANPWAGLLDVQPPGGQQQTGQPGQQPAGQQPNLLDPNSITDLIARTVQSAFDRHVNALNNPQYRAAHGQQQPGQPQQGQPPQGQPTGPTGPSTAELGEARMAFRLYLGDRIALGSETERAVASDLAAGLLPQHLSTGMYPDAAARLVAAEVATRITDLRRGYEETMIRSLRQRGLLNEAPQAPAGMQPGVVGIPAGGMPAGVAQQQQQQSKLARMQGWAAQENASRGWQQPAATQPATAPVGG